MKLTNNNSSFFFLLLEETQSCTICVLQSLLRCVCNVVYPRFVVLISVKINMEFGTGKLGGIKFYKLEITNSIEYNEQYTEKKRRNEKKQKFKR